MEDEINIKTDGHKATHKFIIEGTHCSSCAEIIKRQAIKVDGVEEFKFDVHTETAEVTYDKKKTSLDKIFDSIENKGYQCYNFGEKNIKGKTNKALGWIFGLAGMAVLAYFFFS